MGLKKYIVLGCLFILPTVVYLFFASGSYHFQTLPVVAREVVDIPEIFPESSVTFAGNITVLVFLGDEALSKYTNVFNLNEKIYKRFHKFNGFQFVAALPIGSEEAAGRMMRDLQTFTGADAAAWKIIYGTPQQLEELCEGLHAPEKLDAHYAIDRAFLIDKDKNLRGRSDERRFSYDVISVSEISKVFTDDVKILLAEYRLANKKNKDNEQ